MKGRCGELICSAIERQTGSVLKHNAIPCWTALRFKYFFQFQLHRRSGARDPFARGLRLWDGVGM